MYRSFLLVGCAAFLAMSPGAMGQGFKLPKDAVREATVAVIEITKPGLEQSGKLAALSHQADTFATLEAISSRKSVFLTVEIPYSLRQSIVQLHVSSEIEQAKLNERLKDLGLPAARKQSDSFAISLFSGWQTDSTVSIGTSNDERINLFSQALSMHNEMPVRAAVAIPHYFERTLRETTKMLPEELGGAEMSTLLDGAKWVSIGVDPQNANFSLTAEANNPAAAEKLASAVPGIVQSVVETLSADIQTPDFIGPMLAVLPKQLMISHDGNMTNVTLSKMAADSIAGVLQLTESIVEPISQRRITKNLKQIALAFLNYESANRSFPPAKRARDADGKPRLSWRVHILPYMGMHGLYSEFNLDEPWDSEHNIKLLPRMPEIYGATIGTKKKPKPGHAVVQAPRGEKTIAGQDKAVRFLNITDGTSNTILVVVAAADSAVPWTKPADFEYDASAPASGLELDSNGAFAAAMADGSVHRIPSDRADVINALFTMNGGEVVDWRN